MPGVPKLIGYRGHNYRFHYIITERFGHMTLDKFIMTDSQYSDIRTILQQLVSIVHRLQDFNILHCNIRCSNIVINCLTLKIILTGFSSCLSLQDNHYYYTKINRVNSYTLPEWIKFKRFTANGITVWTIGIILYCLIYKKKPFDSVHSILYHKLSFSPSTKVSLETLVFLDWCLNKNPKKRMTVEEMKNHPWITELYI